MYPLLQNSDRGETQLSTDILSDLERIQAYTVDSEDLSLRESLPIQENAIDSEQTEPQLCINNTCFTIEIADSPQTRRDGLMNREYLDPNAGMLFIFDTPRIHTFRMKNTLIPLDVVWLDEDMVVVDTATMRPCIQDPCETYTPQADSVYAVEINA